MGSDEGLGTPGAGAGLQFDKVEHASPEAARACERCKQPILDEYFEIGGHVVCRPCAQALGGGPDGDGPGPFLRALALGGGAALVGTVAWFLIIKLTDSQWGIVAVGVGILIGLAVRRGSGGRGGSTYQALAILLTYVSITASQIPFILDDTQGSAGFAEIVWMALAAPFSGGGSGINNIIGIIIIGIALYEAWKLNKAVPVSGPFRMGPSPAATAAPPTPPPPSAP